MKDRIKQIRKDAGLNQNDFGTSLGLSRIMIAHVETEKAKLSDRSIRDICRVYHVNENWLRTGEGDPYVARSKNQQIAEFMNDVMEDVDESVLKKLILALSKLDEDEWELIAKLAESMVKDKK